MTSVSMADANAGVFSAIHAAPPYSTSSVARLYDPPDGKPGPPPVRTRDFPDGLPVDSLPASHAAELRKANETYRRTCILLAAAFDQGAHISLEQPADRSDPTSPLFTHHQHGSFWQTSWYLSLAEHISARTVTFALCMLGADHQKYTTIAYSAELHPTLGPLATQSC